VTAARHVRFTAACACGVDAVWTETADPIHDSGRDTVGIRVDCPVCGPTVIEGVAG
jgi:hypothetical protein